MIAPKTPQPTRAEARAAYALASERDGGVCVRCRRAHPIHGVSMDHRKNRSQGGSTVVTNLQTLCGSGTTGCHGWATSHPAEAVAEGWAVPGWGDPAAWPARRWFKGEFGIYTIGWVLYRPDGGVLEITAWEAERRMNGGV